VAESPFRTCKILHVDVLFLGVHASRATWGAGNPAGRNALTLGHLGFGGVFKITPTGTYSVIYNFDGTAHGKTPRSGLTLGNQRAGWGTSDHHGKQPDASQQSDIWRREDAVFTVNSDTKITATVPTGAITGKIQVTTSGGTASSATAFTGN